MKTLITGGAGFVGSHLAEALLAEGHEVTAIDNFATSAAENIRDLRSHARFRFVEGSVLDAALMRDVSRGAEVIYHLAAAVGVKRITESPLRSIQTNIHATELVLECAAETGARVLLTSTSEVYGKNENCPLREDSDSVIGPTQISRWLYANSKAAGEFLAFAYYRERGVPVVIVRLFNLTGPRQSSRYGMVVPRFIEAALKGEPLLIYGDGQQTRCFTDVRDAVRACVRLMETPQAIGQVFNIGSTQEITIEKLARTVLRLAESNAEIRSVSLDEVYPGGFEETRRRRPDVTRLRRTIGFAPDTPLEETLLRMIEETRARLQLTPRKPELVSDVAGSRPAIATPVAVP